MILKRNQFCHSKSITKVFFLLVTVAAILLVGPVVILQTFQSSAAAKQTRTIIPDPSLLMHTDTSYSELPFKLNSSFKIPWHKSNPLHSVMSRRWFHELNAFLIANITSDHPIVIVSGDLDFKKPLINWLIAATVKLKPPIRNILVITFSQSFCYFLNSKKYPCKCLVIPPETITAESMYRHEKWLENFYKLLIARVLVFRMLTYWGFDVANFDSDAIILKNPIPLYYSKEYADNDIVGTFGGDLPHKLRVKWGEVPCMGCIFIRSTEKTEKFWNIYKQINEYDDQVKFNYGLDKAGIQWTNRNMNRTNSKDSLSIQWEGKTADGLKITLLPQRMACREYGCVPEVRSSVYVWHRGMSGHKGGPSENASLKSNVWFYRDK